MTKIAIAALNAEGNPHAFGEVVVRLVDAGSGGAIDGGVIVAPRPVRLDEDGEAEVDLTPTAEVDPAGTFYAVTVNDSTPTVVRYIEVPAPNGTGDAEVPFDWDDPDLERLIATPPTHIPAPGSGTVGQVLGVVDPGDGPRYDLIDQTGGGAVTSVNGQTGTVVLDAEPLFFDLTGLGPTYALDLSAVPDAVKSVTVRCDGPIALTITPPVRPDQLGLVVSAGGGGAITAEVVGFLPPLAGTGVLFAYLEPLPPALGIGMQLGPRPDPVVASVNGQTGVVVLDADDIGDGTTNKAYTAAEQSKLAAITGTNTGDQTLPTLSSLGAVPTSRTLAGLDLTADRSASAVAAALPMWQTIANTTLGSASGSQSFNITGYRFVRITVAARSNRNGSIDTIRLRFNGDTGSNYSTNAGAPLTYVGAFDIAGENTNTDRSGYTVIQFGYMAGSWLTGTVMGTGPSSTATTAGNSLSNGFAWKGATSAAPTSIEVYTAIGQFVAGSSFLVEGRT